MATVPRAVYANGRVSFEVSMLGEAWHCCLLYR